MFDDIENKHDIYTGDDSTIKLCRSLREHAMKIISSVKNKMIPLSNELQESHGQENLLHLQINVRR